VALSLAERKPWAKVKSEGFHIMHSGEESKHDSADGWITLVPSGAKAFLSGNAHAEPAWGRERECERGTALTCDEAIKASVATRRERKGMFSYA